MRGRIFSRKEEIERALWSWKEHVHETKGPNWGMASVVLKDTQATWSS